MAPELHIIDSDDDSSHAEDPPKLPLVTKQSDIFAFSMLTLQVSYPLI